MIYVADGWIRSLFAISGSTDTFLTSVPVGDAPFSPAVNPNTNMIYVTNFGSNLVSVIDGSTNSLVANVPRALEAYLGALQTQIG